MAKDTKKTKPLYDIIHEKYISAKTGQNSVEDKASNIELYLYDKGKQVKTRHKYDRFRINMLWMVIENLCALMSDTPIDILVNHKKPDTEIDAMIYQQAVNYVLERNGMVIQRERLQKFMLFFGTGAYKLSVEKDEIKIKTVDTRNIVVDPLATSPEDVDFIIEVKKYKRNQLAKMYPDKKKEIYGSDGVVTGEILEWELEDYNNSEEDRNKQYINVYEYWGKETDEEKYPYGRYVVSTEKIVLEDRPNEYTCGFPYVFVPGSSIPDRMFGGDWIEFLKEIMDVIVRMYNSVNLILEKTANPQKIVNINSGIKPSQIKNDPGQVIAVRANDINNAMKWESPPPIHPAYFSFAEKMEDFFQRLSGVHDVMQGRGAMNAGTPSGKSIEEMQQAAQTRVRQLIRNMKEFAYNDLGGKLVNLIHQTFTDDKMIRITGGDAELIQKVMTRQNKETAQMVVKAGAMSPEEIQKGVDIYNEEKGIRFFKQTDVGNAYLTMNAERLGDPTEFDIGVKAGTDLPKGKMDIAAMDTQLFQADKIDMETWLESVDHPNKEKILQRDPSYQMSKAIEAAAQKNPQIMQVIQQLVQQIMSPQKDGGGNVDAPQADTGAMQDAPPVEGQPIETENVKV